MTSIADGAVLVLRNPVLFLFSAFVPLVIGAWLGASRFRHFRAEVAEAKEDFAIVQGATLTLLGLIIGFTFSMALGRYDQRKDDEAHEANAIGTEYVRAGLLPAAEAAKVRSLLVSYLDERILFYTTTDDQQIARIDARTAGLQADLWATVEKAGREQPTMIVALAVEGMNDVLNAQAYTQAAWWYQIPVAAWLLMMTTAFFAMVLVGLRAHSAKSRWHVLVILPVVVTVAFYLIADIDSPRRGLIHVVPQNLVSLAHALHP